MKVYLVNQIPSTQAEFVEELSVLRTRFEAMQPELEVTVRDPELGVEGFVVVWNTKISAHGPLRNVGKGGTRVTKDLTLHDVRRLARAMAQKNAAAGLPLGGAKSGLRQDPSEADYERNYRRFVELCAPFLYENGGIFGGFGYDVGGIPPLNAIWACDQLGSTSSFTGKPIEMGGTNYDVEGIAGLGVAEAAHTLLTCAGEGSAGRTFSVQGAGAMGAAVIRYFTDAGGVLSCVSDPKYGGTWHLERGPSGQLLAALIDRDGASVTSLLRVEAKRLSSDSSDALYAEVDVLFPCAMEDALHEANVELVRARYISEGANNAITDEAHRRLFERGISVVPDIIANAGGIIAAFVELTAADTADKAEEAKRAARSRIAANVEQLCALTRSLNVASDQAADFMAYKAIFDGTASS